MTEMILDVATRILRLENHVERYVWVAGVLAATFGISGATLWTKLQTANGLADQLQGDGVAFRAH